MTWKTFGHWLRAERKRSKLTQLDLSRRIGMSQSWLVKVEKGRLEIGFSTAIQACEVLKVPMDRAVRAMRGE